MTDEEQAKRLQLIRERISQVQQLVYRVGMSGRYHAGKARDMVADVERVSILSDVADPAAHQQSLPSLIAEIERLDAKADSAWVGGDSAGLAQICAKLFPLYDQVSLQPRCYERLVRQPDKPMLVEAQQACHTDSDDQDRVQLEESLRMSVEDYVSLEAEIATLMTAIDADRDAIAMAHREASDDYIRSHGIVDEVALSAGFLGVRRAVNCFDDRKGYTLASYMTGWIDRELDRAGFPVNE